MGSSNGSSDEFPVHKVSVDSFWISKSEVTIWEYLECVKSRNVPMPEWWNKKYFDESSYPMYPDWLNFPISGISWEDAVKYCRWKGEKYRLPTEEEWEYAARAGTTTEYIWGDKTGGSDILDTYDPQALKYANIEGGLKPVKSKEPNNWGIYDMTGNVWEWCLDIYSKDTYLKKVENSTTDNKECNDVSKKYNRSVRGGSWNEYSFNLRISNRSSGEQDKGYKGVGFRIVYDPNK